MIKCKICGEYFKVISNTHLSFSHKTTLKEYNKKFKTKNYGFIITPNLLSKDDSRYKKWRASLSKRPASWNKGFTKENHLSVAKISKTFKRKKIDNFSSWRKEAIRKGLYCPFPKVLKKNEELAFLTGLTLGDGNIHLFPRTECLTICLGTDKPELWKYSTRIVHAIFGKKPSILFARKSASVRIRIYKKYLSNELGIPTGSRYKLNIKLPIWIWKNKKFLVMCLKGLFEAEGSFSVHAPTYTYNFQFSNINKSLLKEVENALIALGFHPEVRSRAVRLRKKQEALNFKKLINFRKY